MFGQLRPKSEDSARNRPILSDRPIPTTIGSASTKLGPESTNISLASTRIGPNSITLGRFLPTVPTRPGHSVRCGRPGSPSVIAKRAPLGRGKQSICFARAGPRSRASLASFHCDAWVVLPYPRKDKWRQVTHRECVTHVPGRPADRLGTMNSGLPLNGGAGYTQIWVDLDHIFARCCQFSPGFGQRWLTSIKLTSTKIVPDSASIVL